MNLIIMIDLWDKSFTEIEEYLPVYVKERKKNILTFLNKIKNSKNFHIYNANYCEKKCNKLPDCRCSNCNRKLLKEVSELNLSFIDKFEIPYNNIFLFGLSLDGCVIKRQLGYFNINHPNKFIIKDCCLNENPIRGDISDFFFRKNNYLLQKDVEKNTICHKKWIKNGKIEWPGPYYYFKNTISIKKYENFILKTHKLNTLSYNDIIN